jgi:hypothetical protein
MSKPSAQSLEKIISCSRRGRFHGASGTFAKVMARAIVSWRPRKNGFKEALDFFSSKRREVLLNDAKINFLKGKYWPDYSQQLVNYDRYRDMRILGKKRVSIITEVTKGGAYHKLFCKLDRLLIQKKWVPDKTIFGPKMRRPAYTVKRLGPKKIRILHSSYLDIPLIFLHLNRLWNQTLKTSSKKKALFYIASFEWWFFVSIPVGRFGASLGFCLSITLQIKKNTLLDKKHRHLDWMALHKSHDDYIAWRLDPTNLR